tara:strand:+ start:362 stop:691 length:330 start_codon:yes stop_codon:yes gene_type:complete
MTIKHKSFLLIPFFFIISSCAINDQKDLNYSNQDPIIGTILEITKVMIERDSISKNAIELIEGVELLIQTNEGDSISIIQKNDQYSFILGDKVLIQKTNNQSKVIPSQK